MNPKTKSTLSVEEMERIAIEFENREFTPEELTAMARTRRSTPRPAPTAERRSTGGSA